MAANSELIYEMARTFKKKGGGTLRKARKDILLNCKDESSISQALRHFSKVTLHGALPVFPALLSIACEAVGGNSEKTVPFGKTIVMISGAADLHDDVIDQSVSKGTKQTVFGKFGKDITILAGDCLLVQGFTQLNKDLENLPKNQRRTIRELVADAVFEISTAEALERQLITRRFNLTPEEYNEVFNRRAVVPELLMKMGAIIGNGSQEKVEALGQFGRTFGIITAAIDEFLDLLDFDEVKNRQKTGCLPLPVIYALQNSEMKMALLPVLDTDLMDVDSYAKIVDTTIKSPEIKLLKDALVSSVKDEQLRLATFADSQALEELKILLVAPLKYLEKIVRLPPAH